MSRDKTRIRSIAKSMRKLDASEEEIDYYICLCMFKKPHVIAQIRKQKLGFLEEKGGNE